ncbi:MAG: threonine ammonia-lyase, biosynthetic, partial [Synechococcus sp. ChSW.bin.154]
VKVDAVRQLGAEVVLHGETYDEAYAEARSRSEAEQLCFIHPFDDPEVIAGQGTVGMEILRQCHQPPDAIYVAVGGGGLIGGIAVYVKSLWPDVQIIGVEPHDAAAMTLSLEAGERIRLPQVGLFADGVAVREVGEHTFALAQKYVDDIVTVSTDEICAAIKDVFEDTRSILEPAGALAIAGLKADVNRRSLQNQNLVAVACGANINFARLRFVAERAELGEEREAMLAVEIPERPGSLRCLCELLADRSLTEFSYRMGAGDQAHIFMGVQVSGPDDRSSLIDHLKAHGYACLDLSDDELSKVHLRHMVGGRLPASSSASNVQELLYRFEFPERPGALMRFVTALHRDWSISIFHYRNHGADVGRIVVGVLVSTDDLKAWQAFLRDLGYSSWEETSNPAYQLFLGG